MKQIQNKVFERLYLFALKAKGTTGIYFMAFVCFYLIMGIAGGKTDVSIDIWKAIQMIGACILIGFGQAAVVPTEKLSFLRGTIWLLLSSFVTVGFTLLFKWFQGFPVWCGFVFCTFLITGLAAYLLGLLYDTRQETEKLNKYLKEYRQRLG